MSQFSKKLVLFVILSTNLIAIPQLYAANNDQTSTSNSILLKAADIKFNPAPGFPKGAQITLLRGDLSQAVPYTIRFKLPNDFVIPAHWHTTDEELTVLSGTLYVGTGDTVVKSQSTALTAGGYQLIPAKAHHYVWTTGETVFQLDGMGPRVTTFVNPKEWNALIQKSNNK